MLLNVLHEVCTAVQRVLEDVIMFMVFVLELAYICYATEIHLPGHLEYPKRTP